ncbi:hypothetical protein U1Q18_000960 [Sarracenia purpurea var. burkii]
MSKQAEAMDPYHDLYLGRQKHMARHFDIVSGGAVGEAVAAFQVYDSRVGFYFCMIVISMSILSMVIFACGESSSKTKHGNGGANTAYLGASAGYGGGGDHSGGGGCGGGCGG